MLRLTTIALIAALVMTASGCGGGSSAQSPPPPSGASISSISPTTAVPGSPDLSLTVNGSNFANGVHKGSRVVWSANGTDTLLATTFISSNQLIAVVPAALLKNVGTALVLVETGDPMGDIPLTKSNSFTFIVANPPPGPLSISSLSPATVVAGSPDLNLTVTGTNFISGKPHKRNVVVWSANGSDTRFWNTGFVVTSQVTAVIPAALLTKPLMAQVRVEIWDTQGDAPEATSNSLQFRITSGASGITPASDTLGPNGARQFAVTGFGNNSAVNWGVEEGSAGGTITSTGFYTAPANQGTFHIIATSSSDLNTMAVALVTVTSSGFTPTGTMHVARSGHTATLLKNGKVLIIGGGDDTAELFDPATGTFSFTGPPVVGRLGASATLLSDGRVFITGGFGLVASPDGGLPLEAEIFDPATGTFSATGSMLQGRWNHTATLLKDGRTLVAGGFKGLCDTASTELFDPATGTFSSAGFMLSERLGHSATLLDSGEVLVAGGSNGCRPDSSDDPPWDPLFAELFEPSSKSFQGTGDMSTTRIDHSAIRMPDGKVLMLGGIPTVQNLHEQLPNPSYAELYDPARHTFSPIAGLSISDKRYTATLLDSGMILIAGGEDPAGNITSDALLLNLSTGALNPTGGLGTARIGHTATSLQDGRVLVTGGSDSKGNATATAELYK